MAQETGISWTDLSWNPTHGCSRVSAGCKHCYAEVLSQRYGQTPKPWTALNAVENVLLKPHKLREPLSNAKAWCGLGAAAAAAGKSDGKLVFVNSMSDLFHEQIPDGYIAWVFWIMHHAPQHTFQILTKRPERMRDFMVRWADRLDRDATGEPEHRMALARGPEQLRAAHNADRALLMADMLEQWGDPPAGAAHPTYDWMEGPITWPDVPPNVWLGVSIENRKWVGRADILRETPAAVRFISAEPLLEELVCPGCKSHYLDASGANWCQFCEGRADEDYLHVAGIDWLIVGGESGSGHRPFDVRWARDLRDACAREGGPAFFVKQLGGHRPGTALEHLPEDLRIREFPAIEKLRATA